MKAARKKKQEEVKESWQQTQQQLAQTKSELHDVREELSRSQSQLNEVLGELKHIHFELNQLQEKVDQNESGSARELKQELEEIKAKLQATERLLEQSQLGETMYVFEQYKSELDHTTKMLEESQPQLPQKESGLKQEVEKTEQQKSQVGKTQQFLEHSDEQNRLFNIQNAIVKPIEIRDKWVGGVVFPDNMPEIFRHRRGGSRDQEIVYMDQLIEANEYNNVGNNTGDRQIDSSKTYRGTYIYGGAFHPHFGHAFTESIHRLWAFDTSIHDGIVFAVSLLPNTNYSDYTPPQWFIQTLEIIEIPLDKCIWVTNDCSFENIIIPEPGSELSLGPKQWYRPYLEKLQHRILELTSHRRKDKPDKLFLGRNHIRFSGNIAGEQYFETLLVNEGYTSIKPENYDLLEQLAYIINAKKIIFSEGSAIYILELMNYLDIEIACIPRRGGNKSFYPHIYSKCHNYVVVGNLQDVLSLTDWRKHINKPLTINKHPYQIVESLIKNNFASLKNWDENKFLTEEKNYILTYIKQAYNFLPNRSPAHRAGVMKKYLQVRGTIQENLTSPASNSTPTRSRSDRLNKLASINQSSRYLEIGVSKGITFNAINIENKVAVDPQFQLDQKKYATDKVVFLEVSSDEFFKSYAHKFELYDLIYLDGLHTFEQTFRDFCATQAYAHSKTIWLIDDTCPRSYAQAQSSVKRCRQIQKFSGEKDAAWMGDVFKIVAAIHDFFPQYSFATFPDHGQTVVWNHPRTDFDPLWNSLEIISGLQYADFVELQNTLFKREPYENVFERIRHDLSESENKFILKTREEKHLESESKLTKVEQMKSQVEKTEQFLEHSDEQNRLFNIQNAIVKPIEIRGKWVGGVVFPDNMPEIFRHRRGGSRDQEIVYMDQLIEANEYNNVGSNTGDRQIESLKTYQGTYIYGGPFHPHFGHAFTESIHRLWAFDTNIHDGIVFAVSLRPNIKRNHKYTPPRWFIQALEILKIPLDKCMWVTNDCSFEKIVIPEPGSELSLGPKQWYRPYLEKLQHRILELTSHSRKNKPEKLFLGRNHLRFGGSLAGDKYLESLLLDEGYISLKPENYDLLEQFAYIINAKKIIFSEGSSIYTTELINYLETEIACIPRREGNKPFYPHLQSKCHNYIIAGNVGDMIALGNWEQKGIKSIPISKNPSKIIELLRKHNFALLKDWDENKFLAEEKQDFITYVDAVYNFLPSEDSVHRAGVVEKYLQLRGIKSDQLTYQHLLSMETRSRSERLNKLASINQSSRYLEIGVSKGITFNAINIENKVAVDPQFQLDQKKYATDKVVFLEVSSDEFFKSYAKDFKSFDLIYLDGLHTFEQTFRDFCATQAYAHSKTIWLIDDTCPGSYAQAQSSLNRCRQIQKFSDEKTASWMGDVFKIVAAIHDFFPQYSFATFPHHGQTVVWNHPRKDFQPLWNSLEIISRLEYADFVELQTTLFKTEPYEKIFERIRHDLGES